MTIDTANSEFAYSNSTSITTNFRNSPYHDDFDKTSDYYRILFKPGYAVQARELTQIQSMIQEQINRFGQHIFQEGSMVLGGKYYVDTRANYVKIKDKDSNGDDVDIADYQDQIVTGQTTGIRAYVNLTLDGNETSGNTKTLYVTYISGNPDTDETAFTANEPLVSNVGTIVVANTVPVGFGSVFTINEGVRFAKEHFILHEKQSVVIDRYDIFPTCKVGFMLEESIVDASEDSTLLDPAQESSNFSAPGADRFSITPVLTRLEKNDPAGYPDYVNLFEIEKGIVTEIAERPAYNVIRDEIAKRTMDESGDYYVRGFNVVIQEHLDIYNNGGYLTADRGGDSSLLSIQVEPGTAYVKGYEVNKLVTSFLTTEKSTTFSNVNSQSISSKLGNYVILNEAVGAWNTNIGQGIDLYDTAQRRISTGVSSTAAQTGNKIGSANVKSISYDSGYLGTANGTIRLHLFNVNMLGSNSFANVRSVFADNSTTADLGGDIVLSSNVAKIQESFTPLLYYIGTSFTKTIRSPDGSIDSSFTFKRTSDVSIDSDGTFTLSTSAANENFPYGTGDLSAADKTDLFLSLNESFNIALPGTTTTGAGANVLGGSSTTFTRLNVGDKITFSGNASNYLISAIANDTSLTVTTTLPANLSGNTVYKAYESGDMIDMRAKGIDAGTTRSVATTPTSMTFDIKETLGGTIAATVSYNMIRTTAKEIKKILKTSRYVTINCATHSANTTGPYDLGFSDIFRIRSIRKDSSVFANTTQGTDVTYNFLFDSGQRDGHYEHGKIYPSGITLSNTDNLLICLDYFKPDFTLGVGYFSIDSYPINDSNPGSDEMTTTQLPIFKSRDTGRSYNLRNYFDFRPVFENTATDTTTLTGITTNPSSTVGLQYETSGLRIPAESESISYDYSYYLARRDIVAINKDGEFKIIKGVPSVAPVTPHCPPHLMSLAKMFIPPYPSMSPNYAKNLGRSDLACRSSRTAQVRFTMKDIGVLKQRIDNLENYVSLSLLEKSALDMKILDENGLDRFKNGIFVDSFTSFSLSDISNPDHHICYDPKEGSIRPLFETQAIGYDYYSGSNITRTGDIITLPYTEVIAVTQPYATTIRNVETTVYRFIGKLYLDPDSDFWVNTERLASQTYQFGTKDADVTPYSVVYGSWQTTVTGVTTSDPILISSTTSSGGAGGQIPSSQSVYYGAADLNMAGSGLATIEDALPSLLATYGASTPVSVTEYANPTEFSQGAPLQSTYTITLGELAAWIANPELAPGFVSPGDQLVVEIGGGGSAGSTTTNTYQIVTSTASQASRTFTETFQTLQTQTQSIGDKLVSVAPIADIRPQVIAFEGRGLKSGTRHYVFFDGQLMSSYVTPGIVNNPPASLAANTSSSIITANGSEGDSLYSDDNGYVFGFLRLPADGSKSFRTGTKEVLITDSPTNEPDATSAAKAYFVAQGITQSVQETILSTGQVVTETKSGVQTKPIVYSNTTNTYTTTTSTEGTPGSIGLSYIDGPSCMAYSFKLNTPAGEEGTFLSSVDVFFAAKDPNLGVWFEIRAMDNAGTITKRQVPGSEVWLEPSEVNTSDDGETATNIKFREPIFLLNNQEYAFIIHTVGINPNYYMYVSVLGEKDIGTQLTVNSRPLTGSLFTTNNNTDWDIVQRVDLKITFYRAKFDTTLTGEAVLGNQHREFIKVPLTVASAANSSWFGDRIIGNDELNLSTPSGTISVGDYLIGSNSGANTTVVQISGSRYSMANTGYEVGDDISVVRANGLSTDITSSVVSKNTASGILYKTMLKTDLDSTQLNSNTALLIITDSDGLFTANDTLHYQLSGNTVSVNAVSKYIYSTVQFEPSYIDFVKTTCDFTMLAIDADGTVGNYGPVIESNPMDFDVEKTILSRTDELTTLAGAPSNRVKVIMNSSSDYLSPLVNLRRTYSVYIHNLINSNTTNETRNAGGALKNKYISQVVTLAEGQDAEDLRIVLTAYRPPSSNSEVLVYARIANNEDFESIYARDWVLLEAFDTTAYSSLANRKDWREFQYKFPDSMLTGSNDQDIGIVEYRNSANTLFTGFKQFQIKIGLQSDMSAIYPRVADLRCICLQL